MAAFWAHKAKVCLTVLFKPTLWPAPWPWAIALATPHILGQITHGRSQIKSSNTGLLNNFSALGINSSTIGLTQHNIMHDGDHLSLSLSHPLRVNSGDANINADLWDQNDNSIGLVPSGHQRNIELTYARQLASRRALKWRWLMLNRLAMMPAVMICGALVCGFHAPSNFKTLK